MNTTTNEMPDICPTCGERCELNGDAQCYDCTPPSPRLLEMLKQVEQFRREIENIILTNHLLRVHGGRV